MKRIFPKGDSFGYSWLFFTLVTFLLAVNCQNPNPSEKNAGSPCYKMDENGMEDLNRPQVSMI